MGPARLVTRRTALRDMGKAGLAIVVFGTACSDDSEASTTLPRSTTTTVPGATTSSTPADTTTSADIAEDTRWERVEMSIVSAYILYRGGEAALVDTGQSGAAPDIDAALGRVGLGWDAVSHVILTHKHPDHVGSLGDVVALAPEATIHVGPGDAAAIGQLPSGAAQPAEDGASIFDLLVIATPGHTPGHIAVLDASAGILVAGDAMNRSGGTLTTANPAFTADTALANASVEKLAGFDYDIVLFGHGDPILSGGSDEVAALAASLP